MYVCHRIHTSVRAQLLKTSFLYLVGPGDRTLIIRLGSKDCYLLVHILLLREVK